MDADALPQSSSPPVDVDTDSLESLDYSKYLIATAPLDNPTEIARASGQDIFDPEAAAASVPPNFDSLGSANYLSQRLEVPWDCENGKKPYCCPWKTSKSDVRGCKECKCLTLPRNFRAKTSLEDFLRYTGLTCVLRVAKRSKL